MRWKGLAIAVGITALLGATFLAVRGLQLTSPPIGTERQQARTPFEAEVIDAIRKLKTFDAAAYARKAIERRDYRQVTVGGQFSSWATPGITCLTSRREERRLFFGDVGYAGKDELEAALVKAATAFNRALAADARYPDKDVCFSSDRRLPGPQATTQSAHPQRRPAVVNLHTAVRARNEMAVKRFIASGADVNASDEWSQTPLMWAARRTSIAMMKGLLDAGARVDQTNGRFEDATAIAVQTGDANVLHALLTMARAKGFPPHRTNIALDAAVGLKRVDLVSILLSFDEFPSDGDIESWRVPMGEAVRRKCAPCLTAMLAATNHSPGRAALIQDLVSEEIDRSRPLFIPLVRATLDDISYSSASRQALEAAAERDHAGAVVYLLRRSQNANLLTPQEVDQLRNAAANGDEPAMEKLLAEATKRRAALDNAIRSSNHESVRAAVPADATLNQDHTFTPLMLAAMGSDSATIEILISLGAQPNATIGGTSYGNWQLLSPGDSADGGATPLYYAVKQANIDTARALVRHEANLDARSGPWPLLTEIGASWEEKVPLPRQRAFLDWVLKDSAKSDRQRRADLMLAAAANWGRRDPVRILLKHGADPCATVDYYPKSAVVGFANQADLALLKVLIKQCRDWSDTSQIARDTLKNALSPLREWTPASLEIARYLLSRKIPLPPPEYGATVLDSAVSSRNFELIKLLLEVGANINEICEERTALDWARYSLDNKRTIEFLRARGAKTAEDLGIKRQATPFPF